MSAFMKVVKLSTGLGSLGIIAYYSLDKFPSPVTFAANPTGIANFKPAAKWDDNWDLRHTYSQDCDTKSKKRLAVRHLILIRHGQYNLNGTTDADRILTPLGRKQANMTGERLKQLGLPYSRLIHSTMARAKETAEIIHKHILDVPVMKCALIEEGLPVEPEPPFPPSTVAQIDRINYFEDGARIEAGFRKYFHRANPKQEEDSFDVIVCHANVIRYFVCRALQLPPEAWLRMSLKHASITWLSIYEGGRVSLVSYSDAGYMPPDLMTTT